MGTEKKRGGCLSLLLKGILAYFILGAIVSFVVSSCVNREYEQALSETTALMDAGDYAGAIAKLDVYWEEHNKSDYLDLTNLYIQCLEMEGKYSEAANIILSIFQERGYEGAKDGVLHTRLSGILPNLSQEEQDNIQQTLDALPDSLEEKQALEQAQKEAEAQAQQEAEAQKAEEAQAAAIAESEKQDRETLQNACKGDLRSSETKSKIRELCENYLNTYPNSSYAEIVANIINQYDAIDANNATRGKIGSEILDEYNKVQNSFYGDYYINYKLKYESGMSSVIGTIQDALGEKGDYHDWVASNIDYLFDTPVSGDSIYVIRTQRTFPEAGAYSFCLVPDGTTRLRDSDGFEMTVEVYREVSEDYIDAIYTQYDTYQNTSVYIENAYDNLEQLGKALEAEEAGQVALKDIV